jgi:hypothetical protein
MSDELKPQSIDTPEFRELMSVYWRSCGSASAGTAANALIAYIDAWGARLAEGTAKDAERWRAWRRWWSYSDDDADQLPDEVMALMDDLELDEAMDEYIKSQTGEAPCGS